MSGTTEVTANPSLRIVRVRA
jgi:IS4 transposase